jgi:hypothetical protein
MNQAVGLQAREMTQSVGERPTIYPGTETTANMSAVQQAVHLISGADEVSG